MFDRSELLICLLLSAEARKPWARWPQFVRRHFVHYLWVLLSLLSSTAFAQLLCQLTARPSAACGHAAESIANKLPSRDSPMAFDVMVDPKGGAHA